jgi:hypothetical protein
MSPRQSHPDAPSAVVPIRLNNGTIKELKARARKQGLLLGSYLRTILEDFAPGRDTNELRKRTGRIKNLI